VTATGSSRIAADRVGWYFCSSPVGPPVVGRQWRGHACAGPGTRWGIPRPHPGACWMALRGHDGVREPHLARMRSSSCFTTTWCAHAGFGHHRRAPGRRPTGRRRMRGATSAARPASSQQGIQPSGRRESRAPRTPRPQGADRPVPVTRGWYAAPDDAEAERADAPQRQSSLTALSTVRHSCVGATSCALYRNPDRRSDPTPWTAHD
jgi:hypothetical protein